MIPKWLQLWLSPRPTQRTYTASEASVSGAQDAIRNDFLTSENGLGVIQETHYLNKAIVRDGKSGPPLHIHLRQDEYFEVQQGVLGVVKNGKEYAVTKSDGRVEIPSGTRHTFWVHSSSTEDLVFRVWVEPQDLQYSFDEIFVRNFSSYMRDCEKSKVAPSIFQLILFLYHSDIVITPPFWMPIWILCVLHHVLAYWVGAGLLGYQTSYPEYSGRPVDHGKEA